MDRPPVLLVHGIFDSGKRLERMQRHLIGCGVPHVRSIDLVPSSGKLGIDRLAEQVAPHAELLRRAHRAERIDLVGFSMGALVSRYFIQRLGGKERVRRFVSISGPHAGTLTAFALWNEGARQMRPGSAFLRALEQDPDPWGPVEVTAIYTPLDLMILPAQSSVLRGARKVVTIPVALHALMLRDRRVLAAVEAALLES